MNEEINLKVKIVWAPKAYPYHLIVELASGAFAWFSITPFRRITTDGQNCTYADDAKVVFPHRFHR